MTDLFAPHLTDFETISLRRLNEMAAMLDRQEHKYVIQLDDFLQLLPMLRRDYYVLDIKGRQAFSYRSQYFDTSDLLGYTYHHQGRLKGRFKVRTRQYVDSGLCFFEVKLKDKRGGTIKKRIPYRTDDYRTITQEADRFMRKNYATVYGLSFRRKLVPQIEVNYQRITLVAKRGGERLTIDFNLSFAANGQTTPVRRFIIAETKTANGSGIADQLFRRQRIRSQSCSKYCLAANLLDLGVKSNRFRPMLKMYDALPLYEGLEHSLEAAASVADDEPARRTRAMPRLVPAADALGA